MIVWGIDGARAGDAQGRADGRSVVVDSRSSDGPGHLYAGWQGEFPVVAKAMREEFVSGIKMADADATLAGRQDDIQEDVLRCRTGSERGAL